MSAEPVGGQVDGGRTARGSLAFDLVLSAVLFTAVTVGFTPWYSSRLFDRAAFRSYYGHGVYRSRVVGRELVLWVDRMVHERSPRITTSWS